MQDPPTCSTLCSTWRWARGAAVFWRVGGQRVSHSSAVARRRGRTLKQLAYLGVRSMARMCSGGRHEACACARAVVPRPLPDGSPDAPAALLHPAPAPGRGDAGAVVARQRLRPCRLNSWHRRAGRHRRRNAVGKKSQCPPQASSRIDVDNWARLTLGGGSAAPGGLAPAACCPATG